MQTCISNKHKKLKTEIGSKNSSLSYSENQRIKLAPIFLNKPKLVIINDHYLPKEHTIKQSIIKEILKLDAICIFMTTNSQDYTNRENNTPITDTANNLKFISLDTNTKNTLE